VNSSSFLRRILAAVFLGSALGMLILGLTVFSVTLEGYEFVFYWLICLGCAGLAGMMALFDLMAIKQKSREAQRELIEEILERFERDQKKRLD